MPTSNEIQGIVWPAQGNRGLSSANGALQRELSFPFYTEPASASRGVACGNSARNRGALRLPGASSDAHKTLGSTLRHRAAA